eukprot:g10996.t1
MRNGDEAVEMPPPKKKKSLPPVPIMTQSAPGLAKLKVDEDDDDDDNNLKLPEVSLPVWALRAVKLSSSLFVRS